MNKKDKLVLYQIVIYLSQANSANLLLAKELQGDPFELWKERKVEQAGNTNEYGLEYFFHGLGCKINSKWVTVDFDYNLEGKINSFNKWVIWNYIKDNEIPMKEEEFEISYANLESLGVIIDSIDGSGKGQQLGVLGNFFN